jgi:hypothetical protein
LLATVRRAIARTATINVVLFISLVCPFIQLTML